MVLPVGLHVRPMPVLPGPVLGGVSLHPRVTLRWPARVVPVHPCRVLAGVLLRPPMRRRLSPSTGGRNCWPGGQLRLECLELLADLVEAIELPSHPFFVATLFQSERRALRGEVPPVAEAFVRALASAADLHVTPA